MKYLMSKKAIRQFGTLLLSNYSLVIISFVNSIFMTRVMHESEFGYYKYAISIILMLVAFINCGFHYSVAKIIAVSDRSKEQSMLSSIVIIMIIISLMTTFFGSSIAYIANVYFIRVDIVVFWAIPLVFTILFQRMFITVLKGNNRIKDIIIQTVLPQILILLFYFGLQLINYKINFKIALINYGLTYLAVHLATCNRLGLRIPTDFFSDFKEILHENKINGFQLYKGSIAGVFVGEVLTVIVGAGVEKATFGMYALALSMSSPINIIPQAMATIKYQENANSKKLSTRNIIFTLVVSLLGLIFLNVGVNFCFSFFFESRYDGVLHFLMLCSIRFLIHGMGDYFNEFSASHGLGGNIKRGAYLCGGAQLISAIILVPKLGITGLIFSNIISSTIYCGSMIYVYLYNISVFNGKREQ